MDWIINRPGIYTLRISQREDGAAVDAFVLQLTSLPAPTGNGPPESALSSGAFEILPKTGGDTGAVTVQFFRLDGFVDGTSVKLVKDGEPPIAGTSIFIGETGTSLKSTFDLTGKSQGLWNVVVTNPDGTSQTLAEAFTIEAGRPAQLWVDLLGLNLIRIDRAQQYWLTFGNKGNVDLYGAHLFLKVPANVKYKLGDDQEFRVFPDDTVAHIYISHLPAQAVKSVPLLLKVTTGQWPFTVASAISDNPEGFRLQHTQNYDPNLGLATTDNALISAVSSSSQTVLGLEEYSPGACPNDPDAILAPGQFVPEGYVDLFIVNPGLTSCQSESAHWPLCSFDEVGVRVNGGTEVVWSFPEFKDKIPPYKIVGGNVSKIHFSDFNFTWVSP